MPTDLLERPSYTDPPDITDETEIVNEECPDRCSVEHDIDTYFQCPATLNWWGWCEDHNRYVASADYDRGVYTDNGRMCAHHGREWVRCDGCSDWIRREDSYTRYGDPCCDTCYSDEDDEGSGTSQGHGAAVERTFCSTCETYNDNFDELTEEFICTHEAKQRAERGIPVLMVVTA